MKQKLLMTLAVALAAASCTREIYTPVETRVETHTNASDTLQITQLSKLIDRLQNTVKTREKVVIRDSVVYVVNEQGDIKSKEVYHDKDRDYSESETLLRVTQIYDSLFQRQAQRVDSLLNEFRQELVTVEKEPSVWSKFKGWLKGFAIGLILVGIFLSFRWLKSKIF